MRAPAEIIPHLGIRSKLPAAAILRPRQRRLHKLPPDARPAMPILHKPTFQITHVRSRAPLRRWPNRKLGEPNGLAANRRDQHSRQTRQTPRKKPLRLLLVDPALVTIKLMTHDDPRIDEAILKLCDFHSHANTLPHADASYERDLPIQYPR